MKPFGAIVFTLLGCAASVSAEPPKPQAHTERTIEGWTVHVDDRLLVEPGKELGDQAVRLLTQRLGAVTLVLPADKLTRLKQVTIWLDLTHGGLKSPQYHPSADWLKDLALDPNISPCCT